jgi:hypothetical protein
MASYFQIICGALENSNPVLRALASNKQIQIQRASHLTIPEFQTHHWKCTSIFSFVSFKKPHFFIKHNKNNNNMTMGQTTINLSGSRKRHFGTMIWNASSQGIHFLNCVVG